MEPKIAPLVNRCLALFETFSDSLSSSQAECSITRSHLARFRLWAGSLGAHRASGGRSLEYRLRDSSFVRNHIISLLQELVSSIGEGIQLATTDSDDKEALDDADLDLEAYFQSDDADEQSEVVTILGDIGHIIDCLLRLSITIRNPARHDQFNSRAGADTVSSYSEWDMKHIREKFDRLDGKLVDRLAMAMSRRRQYIKYREEHSKKLAHGLLDEPGEGENATTIASSIPKKLKDEENIGIFTKMDALLDNMSEVSGTSYANSIAATNELRVPSIPKEYIDGPFLCPICHTLIIINDRNSWKKHVFRDLQPYVCLFDNCSSPSQVYQRRKDWVAHMKQEHWVSWSCSFGCSKSFRSQESFEKHVTTIHGQSFESIDLQAVLNLCRVPSDTNTVGTCPFCFDYEIKSDKSYQSHIGDHLERLALFVLPKTLYDDDSDDGDHDNDGDGDDGDDDDGNNDDDDSDIEMRLMKDDEFSNHLQESRGGDSWENVEPDEGNTESTHPLMDYNMQLELLEQANKKRLMRARQEQSDMEGIPQDGQPGVPAGFDGQSSPDTSPQPMKSGTSPNPGQQMGNLANAQQVLAANGINPAQLNPQQMQNFANMPPAVQQKSIATYSHNLQQDHGNQMGNKQIPSVGGPQNQSSPMMPQGPDGSTLNAFYNPEMNPGAQAAAAGSNHALQDYQMQLMQLERENKKRLVRQKQSEMEGIPRDSQPSTPSGPNGQLSPGISPMAAKPGASGTSPNLKDRIRRIISHMDGFDLASQSQMNSTDRIGKTVSWAKGGNILAEPPSTTLKYQEDSPDSHPDSQGSAMRHSTGAGSPLPSPSFRHDTLPLSKPGDEFFFDEDEEDLEAKSQSPRWVSPPPDTGASSLKRYGSLSTFHGEGPIETSPISAPRVDGSDTIVSRPRDYSETQRLKEDEEDAEFAAEQRRVEEQSRELEELKRKGDMLAEKHINMKIEYRRLKEEDSADAAEKMRRLERELDDETELRYLQKQLDAIKEREANAEIWRLEEQDEDAAEVAEEQRRVEEPLRQLEELKRESDIVVEKRINKEAEYRRLKEEDSADAAERIRIVSGMLQDDAELRSLQRKLDAMQKREAGATEKRIMKEPELRRLIEEEYAAEAAEGKRRLEGELHEDAEHRFTQRQPEEIGKSEYKTKAAEVLKPMEIEGKGHLNHLAERLRERFKGEDQDVPMDGDSIKSPYGMTEIEKQQGSATPPGRCLSCNRIVTTNWRPGPDGAMTLCNGCGLHYARLARNQQLSERGLSVSTPEELITARELKVELERLIEEYKLKRLKKEEEAAELEH